MLDKNPGHTEEASTKMATIKDVARLAGVAPSTVSHYFTGNAPVSDSTRARIEQAVRELGYRPNAAARSLRLAQTQSIGLIVPNIANPFFAEIVRAIGYACQQMGYSLLLADSSGDEDRERDLVANLLKQYIDGLLIIHAGKVPTSQLLEEEPPIPVVYVDREVDERASVATDNYLGGRLAARHLIGLGHRRIGILAGDPHVKNVQQRLAGFQDELKSSRITISKRHIISGSQSFETGRDAQLLMVGPNPPTAIFATNDIIALGAWHKLNDMGLKIPGDVSLIGYDNIEMTQWTIPALTTIEQDKRELGRQSVATLVKAIQERDLAGSTIYVPPRIVVRASTGPPGDD